MESNTCTLRKFHFLQGNVFDMEQSSLTPKWAPQKHTHNYSNEVIKFLFYDLYDL